jgi:hypothetical protein
LALVLAISKAAGRSDVVDIGECFSNTVIVGNKTNGPNPWSVDQNAAARQ